MDDVKTLIKKREIHTGFLAEDEMQTLIALHVCMVNTS